MKNGIMMLFAVLMLILVIGSAFNGESTIEIRPAVPKQVIVEHFLLEDKAQAYVNDKLKEGYVLKTWTVDKLHFVVMEKY